MQTIETGIYRHSKTGNEYEVISVALHSENLEPFVVYRALHEDPASPSKTGFWIRPASMWNEMVNVNGSIVPRFVFVRKS
jgi:hypothetical protein